MRLVEFYVSNLIKWMAQSKFLLFTLRQRFHCKSLLADASADSDQMFCCHAIVLTRPVTYIYFDYTLILPKVCRQGAFRLAKYNEIFCTSYISMKIALISSVDLFFKRFWFVDFLDSSISYMSIFVCLDVSYLLRKCQNENR